MGKNDKSTVNRIPLALGKKRHQYSEIIYGKCAKFITSDRDFVQQALGNEDDLKTLSDK